MLFDIHQPSSAVIHLNVQRIMGNLHTWTYNIILSLSYTSDIIPHTSDFFVQEMTRTSPLSFELARSGKDRLKGKHPTPF